MYYLNEEMVLVIVIQISFCVVSVCLMLNTHRLMPTTMVKTCMLTT